MGRISSALLGVGLGAAVAFLFDPARGRSRRARLTDQGAALVRRAWREVARRERMLASTLAGKLGALQAAESGDAEWPDDVTLKDRVESKLWRDPKLPKGSININAEQGIVVLRGEVPDEKVRDRIEQKAARVDGVWSVENLLHLPGEPAPTTR